MLAHMISADSLLFGRSMNRLYPDAPGTFLFSLSESE